MDDIACRHILKLSNVVVIGTGNKPQLNNIIKSKEQAIFCPGSLSPTLQELTLSNIQQIHFSPESIAERNSSLKIDLNHIENDLFFPIGWYDYQYKIKEDQTFQRPVHKNNKSKDLNENSREIEFLDMHEKPFLMILLFEVGNVILSSNTISIRSLSLEVSGAKNVVIEPFAVSEENSIYSLISLRRLEQAQIKSSWGSFLLLESVRDVNILQKGISKSINYIIFKDIQNLTYYADISDLTHIKSMSILNVSSWIVPEIPSSTNYQPERREESDLAREKTKTKDLYSSRIVIQNSHFLFNREKEMQMKGSQISIKNSSFSCNNPLKTILLFIGHEFELHNGAFPKWVHFCQIATQIVCQNSTYFKKICPIGFPYQYNRTKYEALKCRETSPNYNSGKN